jgi:hypothetical protein
VAWALKGVIYDFKGNEIINYTWALGNNSNNQDEDLTVFMGIKKLLKVI